MKRVRRAACGVVAWAAVAGLGLLSGCQTSDPCRPSLMSRMGCCGRQRCAPMGGAPVVGAPVSSAPLMTGVPFTGESPFGMPEGCCEGGPTLPPSVMPGESLYTSPLLPGPGYNGHGGPAYNGHGGPAYNGSNNGYRPPSGMTFGAPIYLPPGAPLPQGAVPMPGGGGGAAGNAPALNGQPNAPALNGQPPTLPQPSPEPPGVLQLTPVPNGQDFARPTPAPPTARRKS